MASIQQLLVDYAKNSKGALPVLIKGFGYSVRGLVVLPRTGLPLVTVRKPTALRVYQVRGDQFEPKGSITRPESYDEFDMILKQQKPEVFDGGHNGAILAAASENECSLFVTQFLKLNPEPTDKQVHELADAVGVDKEELEALIYKMLGVVVAATEEQEVLEDQRDPRFGPTRLTTLNDQGFDPDMIEEDQEDLRDDGFVD